MQPTRSVLASCEPYPHSAQPCRPSPRVSITGRADVTTSSFTGDEFFVTTAVLTPLRAETFRSGLRRPCGLERPQRVEAQAGRRPLQAERPKRVETPFGLGGSTITADDIGSDLPSPDPADPPRRP